MFIPAVGIRAFRYYGILPEKKMVNVARYLEFLKSFMDVWHGNLQHRACLLYDTTRFHGHVSILALVGENTIER